MWLSLTITIIKPAVRLIGEGRIVSSSWIINHHYYGLIKPFPMGSNFVKRLPSPSHPQQRWRGHKQWQLPSQYGPHRLEWLGCHGIIHLLGVDLDLPPPYSIMPTHYILLSRDDDVDTKKCQVTVGPSCGPHGIEWLICHWVIPWVDPGSLPYSILLSINHPCFLWSLREDT